MHHEPLSQSELKAKAQQLVDGPLKHIKAAALAAALLPLASIAAEPASAQALCPSGGVCGTVFDDANNNGLRDDGETGIEGVKVFICQLCDDTDTVETETGPDGTFAVFIPDDPNTTTTIGVLIPTGTQASPPNVGGNTFDDRDSDGTPDGSGFSVAVLETDGVTDFGFHTAAVEQPGTGTPGYWKNHPEAWPVTSIIVGGVSYTKAQALAILSKVNKDRTTTMFSSLVPAMLNVRIGNDGSCVNATIDAANSWMEDHGPVGSGVAGSSAAWSVGEPLHTTLDYYNNGRLCAPHRQ